MLVSFFICVIYSFSEVNKASEFYFKFWINLKIFAPYVIMQLLLLIFSCNILKKLKPLGAIFFLIFLNFFCVYLVYAAMTRSFDTFFNELDETLARFALSFGILFFFLIYFDWREKNLHPSYLQAKLSFLQAKMRPHFLFNTLNSIVSLIKKEPEIAKKMLLNLSELLRASLREENTFMHTISEEILLSKKYLEIEKMRLGERLNVVWNIQEEDIIVSGIIPKLSIQPLIENSVLHGIQNLEDGGTIEISIKKNLNSNLVVEIKNPQPNINTESKQNINNHNNMSTINLLDRLKLCYDGDVKFDITNDTNTYSILLEIPFISKKI